MSVFSTLAPKYFGLYFKVGVLVFIISILLFGVIAKNVMSADALTIIDVQLSHWLHSQSSPGVTQCLLILTHLHDPITISFMVTFIAFYLIWKKKWYELLTVLTVVPGGMLINLLVKQVFERARPSFEHPLVMLTTYSFPSGHVAATTLFYGAIAALLISETTTRSRAIYILLIAFVMVIVVAFSRMYLGAHYLSDVLAAFFEAIAWIALCLIAFKCSKIYHDS